jgi:hypothetical protein
VALTANQIISLATQIAKVPGFATQAQQLLNSILQELAQDYDFEVIRKYFTFPFPLSPGTGITYSYALGSGPSPMPSDYLRLCQEGSYYLVSGVPYNMIAVKQEQFDHFVQQAGLNSYPTYFYIDTAQTPPALYVWPPPSGAFQVSIRYFSLPADLPTTIVNPGDTTVPWFPNSTYLYTRLAGELMKLSNDDRWPAFVSDQEGSGGAGDLLRRYLQMKDEPLGAVKTVKLDRRNFRPNSQSLPNTKQIGW